MTDKIKVFFGIKEKNYKFEITDLFAVFTIMNVVLVLCGFWWAPAVGIFNCVCNIINNIKNRVHLNLYAIQIALIILNCYFLTLK